jgi:hypothetical protein
MHTEREGEREGIIAILAALDRYIARSAARPPCTAYYVRRRARRIELAEMLRAGLESLRAPAASEGLTNV